MEGYFFRNVSFFFVFLLLFLIKISILASQFLDLIFLHSGYSLYFFYNVGTTNTDDIQLYKIGK